MSRGRREHRCRDEEMCPSEGSKPKNGRPSDRKASDRKASERKPGPEARSLHLEVGQLEAILRGELPPRELVRRVVEHLLALCPECRVAWGKVDRSWLEPAPAPTASSPPGAYEAAFDRCAALLRDRQPDLERERAEAQALLDELTALPEARQESQLRGSRRYHTWGVADLLIRASREATFEDPAIACSLARLAIFVAEQLVPERYGAAFRHDVLALAWAYLGNARRVASDLRGAGVALATAHEHLQEGVGEPLTRAQVLNLEASLCRAQRRFPEAESLLRRVIAIYRKVDDPQMQGRATVKLAEIFQVSGRPEDAAPLLKRSLRLISEQEDPRLYLCAHHNLASCLVDAGRTADARALLHQTVPLYERHPDFSTQQRKRWLEGDLAVAEQKPAAAEAAYREVRRAFIERDLGYDAALVSLDLAALYAAEDRPADVKALAEEMLPIFRSRDVHREAMAALLIFQRAARAEEVTLALVRQVAAYLRQARHQPALRYEEPS